jgi:hypothetical protein
VRNWRSAIVAIAGVAVVLILTTLEGKGLRHEEQAVVHLYDGSIVKVSDLTATPLPVHVPEVDGVEYVARQQRFGGLNYFRLPFSLHPNPTTLFLVRGVAGRVRAFIAVDPVSGCSLVLPPVESPQPYVQVVGVFADPCRGALYNEDGAVVGGPGFWELDQVEVAIKGDSVLVYPSRVLLGRRAQ